MERFSKWKYSCHQVRKYRLDRFIFLVIWFIVYVYGEE